MTRTIYVVFNDDYRLHPSCNKQPKEYKFLCNYDIVRVGDKITDPRYTSIMTVIKISNFNKRVQEGMTLKDIYITMINDKLIYQPSGLVNGSIAGSDFDIDKQKANNIERNLKVTLEQAIEWYNSGNETLRTLALTAYTKEELTFNLDYIKKQVIHIECTIDIPCSSKKYKALVDLEMIATYFNKDWKKTPSNTGYFLGQSNLKFSNNSRADMIKGLESLRNIGIIEHNTVMYPGIVYFKEKEDLIKAIKIMGDRVKDLFR